MESRVIKVNPERRAEYPYFARDNSSNYIWFLKGKSERRGYAKALLVGDHSGYIPFEYEGDVKISNVTKITRMRLTLLIGTNVG